MSYAPISRWIIKRVPQLAVGPESWLEWRKIKGQYDTEKGPGFQEPQPTSLQRLGNSEILNSTGSRGMTEILLKY